MATKTTKKAKKPPKKAAKKTTKKRKAKPLTAAEKRRDKKARIKAAMAAVNKRSGANTVARASDMVSSYMLRRPTGIISLDIALAGGWPAGAPVVLVGEDGAGKDYLLWITCALLQRIYGDDFAMAVYLTEFKADKHFMKDLCGFQVGFTDQEIAEINAAREVNDEEPLSEEEVAHYKRQIGEVLIIEGVYAEKGFDAILDFVSTNSCQMVAINSIGFLQTAAKEEKGDKDGFEGFAQQASEAMLMTKFMPKLALTLSKTHEDGERNETSVILVNQMRGNRNKSPNAKSKKHDKRPALQSWALAHGKAAELRLDKGPPIREDKDVKGSPIVGRLVRWEITKGKLGIRDNVSGEFEFYYDGGVDIIGDLLRTCASLGVLEAPAGRYHFVDPDGHGEGEEDLEFKAHGIVNAKRHLHGNLALQDRLRELCFREAKIAYRLK